MLWAIKLFLFSFYLTRMIVYYYLFWCLLCLRSTTFSYLMKLGGNLSGFLLILKGIYERIKKKKYGLMEMTLFVSVPTFYIFGYKVYLINESKKMRFKTKRIMPIFINSMCVCVVELMLHCCSPSWSFSFSFSLCMCISLLGTSCTK